ncbi:MAG: DUF2062 domain-containing protein [Deltaproteobacteria bacterium]|nr:DUF2062 domain-containing protein [Deltaproteobacteria bacterium]
MNHKGKNGINKKHPIEKLKRWYRLTYLKILRIDDPPEMIARGAAIGAFMGVLPTFGVGIILSIFGAFILRANKASAVLGTFIMNPITTPLFWSLSLATGGLMLGHGKAAAGKNIFKEASYTFLAGNLVISAITAAAVYFIVKKLIIRHRIKKAAKREAKKMGLKPTETEGA